MRTRSAAALAATALVVAAGGCGFGAGEVDEAGEGEATLRVTRDYGRELLAEATVENPPESETVIRFLDREAEVETRFGGGFVQSIDGLAGDVDDGRSSDWFFYVDGIESSVGAGEVEVEAGTEVWWDYRDWTDVMRVPAVIGSFPEPLASAPEPVSLECADAEEACAAAGERLAEADVDFENAALGDGEGELRVLVGLWEDVRDDRVASLLEEGPSESSIFVAPVRTGAGWALQAYDASATPNDVLTDGGVIAALRPAEDPPVWIVTGTDEAGLNAAVAALEKDTLRDRYAVTLPTPQGGSVPVPIEEAGIG